MSLHTPSAAPHPGIPRPLAGAAEDRARDAYIAGRLVTAYALSDQLAPYDLQVDVRSGVVTVNGIVDDKVLRELAVDIARQIDEVEDVRCEIAVESPAPRRRDTDAFARRVHDASLAAQVKSRLLWTGETHGARIDVTCDDGVITLSGSVASAATRDVAEHLAREIRLVRGVDNRLELT